MAEKNKKETPSNLQAFLCDPVSVRIMRDVLTEMSIAYSEVRQSEIDEAIEFLKHNRAPKIVMIDLSNSDLPFTDVARVKEYCTPNVVLLAIGSKNDVGLYRDLLKMGVADYVIKPLNDELLQKTLRNVLSGQSGEGDDHKVGSVVSFIGSCGGCGASTLATNVGWLLANKHFKRTVVADLDFFFGNTHLMLDLQNIDVYLDMLSSVEKVDDFFIDTSLKTHGKRLRHLSCAQDLSKSVSADEEAFELMIDLIRRQANYVICDVPRHPSVWSEKYLTRSQKFFVLSELSIASAHATFRILAYLNSICPSGRTFVVVNKVGSTTSGALTRENFERIVNHPIDFMIPYDMHTALAAANLGQPIVSLQSALVLPINHIVDEIIGVHQSKKVAQKIEDEKEEKRDRFEKIKVWFCKAKAFVYQYLKK